MASLRVLLRAAAAAALLRDVAAVRRKIGESRMNIAANEAAVQSWDFGSIGLPITSPSSCSGSGDVSPPMCFQAKETILGITAEVTVWFSEYSNGQSRGNFRSRGMWTYDCQDVPFTKSGQDITLDTSRCGDVETFSAVAKYCSDSQTIEVTGRYTKLTPLPVTFTLRRADCGSSLLQVAGGSGALLLDAAAQNAATLSAAAQDPRVGWEFPILDAQVPCPGSADPVFEGPMCFKAQQTVIGLNAEFSVQVTSFAEGRGRADFGARGDISEDCKDVDFTKAGQDIYLDMSHCPNPNGVTVAMKYCSDVQTVQVTAKYPPVPFVNIKVTLRRVAC